MKLNIKGLVFAGFAAAVFASAANADATTDAKTVTSKTYVDAKYDGVGAVSVRDGTEAEGKLNKRVITVAEMGAATSTTAGRRGTVQAPAGAEEKFLRGDNTWQPIDGTAYTGGDGIVVNNHEISADLVGGGNTTVTVGTGTGVDGNGIAEGAIQIKSPTFTQNGAAVNPENGVVDFTDTTYRFQTGTTAGKFEVSDDNGDTWTPVEVYHAQTTDNKVTAITEAAADITAQNSTGNDTYPTTHAVYEFLMNGWSASNCTDANPCALVVGTNGVPTWQAIAQPGD